MPVTIERSVLPAQARISDIRERRRRRGVIRDRGRRIAIGLVNNMPDSALAATERQFRNVLEAASDEFDVQLRLYALDQVPRSAEALEHLARSYANANALAGQSLDALIVTGAQPVAPDLEAEPYWDALTGVIDWAEANTVSTLLSCLAAHAGVLRFSGISRRRLPNKCSGVFAFDVVKADALTQGAGQQWTIPHSRYNDLDEGELAQNGYEILARSPTAGVDLFIKQMRSLMVFLQGHPEYERETLAREFRRDMSRYLSGELASLPSLPQDYFSNEARQALSRFISSAQTERRVDAMKAFPDIGRGGTEAAWRRTANLLYRNWLNTIAERRAAARPDSSSLKVRWSG
jgi:homoserine O-succinyltransferase/O-acetyltransferase